MKIRVASPSEATALSELAFRSKAHWGYAPDFMQACRAELSVPLEAIEAGRVFVAEDAAGIAGVCALAPLDARRLDLSHLFVEPGRLRAGVGRALLAHAVAAARALGALRLQIQGDPHATGFYVACGARQVGELASGSIPGRVLPLFELALTE